MVSNPIEFGRAAAFVRGITKIDIVGVSLGIIVAQFFGDLAELVGTILRLFFIGPVRTATRELSRLFTGLVQPFQFVLPEAFRQTRVSIIGLELGPFAILAGAAIVVVSAYIIARGRDFAL